MRTNYEDHQEMMQGEAHKAYTAARRAGEYDAEYEKRVNDREDSREPAPCEDDLE